MLWGGAGTLSPADVLLVIEIVSPSSESTDRITKPALYAEAGIAAYWRVELDSPAGITVVTHRLSGNAYIEDTSVDAGQTASIDWPLAYRLAPGSLTGPRER